MEGVSRFDAPNVTLFCLTDGGTTFGPEVFPNVTDGDRAALLADAGLPGIATQFNAYVLRFTDGRIAMVDTGCGALFGPAGGRVAGLLQQLNIAPADVSRLIFTHLHGDHCGGALNGDALVFPNAQVILHADEAAHWAGTDTPGGRLLAMASDIVHVTDGTDLGDGLRVWALPGHTPGHMGVRMDGLALVADVVHSEAVQLPDPRNCPSYDMDPEAAVRSRRAALSEVADHGLVWSGCHMLGPEKFAKLRRRGDGFVRVPL